MLVNNYKIPSRLKVLFVFLRVRFSRICDFLKARVYSQTKSFLLFLSRNELPSGGERSTALFDCRFNPRLHLETADPYSSPAHLSRKHPAFPINYYRPSRPRRADVDAA